MVASTHDWLLALDRYYGGSSRLRDDITSLTKAVEAQTEAAAQSTRTQTLAIQDGMAASASEITASVDASKSEIVAALASQTMAFGVMAEAVVDAITKNGALLASILDTLHSPIATAAKERLTRGVYALERGWADDAVEEFTASIELDRYVPVAHLYLGLAQDRLGLAADAAEAYRQAAKYSAGEQALRATAVLLYCSHVDDGVVSALEAMEVIEESIPDIVDCPEVLLRHVLLSRRGDHLVRALELAPELAPAVAAAGLSHLVDDAILMLLSDADSSASLGLALVATLGEIYADGQGNRRPRKISELAASVQVPPADTVPAESTADRFMQGASIVARRSTIRSSMHLAETVGLKAKESRAKADKGRREAVIMDGRENQIYLTELRRQVASFAVVKSLSWKYEVISKGQDQFLGLKVFYVNGPGKTDSQASLYRSSHSGWHLVWYDDRLGRRERQPAVFEYRGRWLSVSELLSRWGRAVSSGELGGVVPASPRGLFGISLDSLLSGARLLAQSFLEFMEALNSDDEAWRDTRRGARQVELDSDSKAAREWQGAQRFLYPLSQRVANLDRILHEKRSRRLRPLVVTSSGRDE